MPGCAELKTPGRALNLSVSNLSSRRLLHLQKRKKIAPRNETFDEIESSLRSAGGSGDPRAIYCTPVWEGWNITFYAPRRAQAVTEGWCIYRLSMHNAQWALSVAPGPDVATFIATFA